MIFATLDDRFACAAGPALHDDAAGRHAGRDEPVRCAPAWSSPLPVLPELMIRGA